MKLTLNATSYKQELNNLKKNKPPEGNIMVLSVTEKQFSDIEFILGEFETDVINTTDRIVVIE